MPHKFGTKISVHFILDNDSNDAPYTGSRGDVLNRISKPVENLGKKWVILIALQFPYTFYNPTNLYTATDDDGNDVVKKMCSRLEQ